ncbi:hypothetical protein ACFVQ0_01955 [Streptomyces sp. NPDC057900]|uniref:hypothetical protein n=1 Tax=Streptomyces sp. NPDC057900 TaxID=3346274 RepID=UPI0036E20AE5
MAPVVAGPENLAPAVGGGAATPSRETASGTIVRSDAIVLGVEYVGDAVSGLAA